LASLSRFLSFRGRATRLQYWQVQLATVVVAAVTVILAMLAARAVGQVGGVLMLLVLPLVVAGVATGVRRLHDRNRSGWWLAAYWFAPGLISAWAETVPEDAPIFLVAAALSVVGLLVSIWSLVDLGFLKGTPGPNRYGADPHQPTAAEVFG